AKECRDRPSDESLAPPGQVRLWQFDTPKTPRYAGRRIGRFNRDNQAAERMRSLGSFLGGLFLGIRPSWGKKIGLCVYGIAMRLRATLMDEGEFATVLRGAGLALVIRVLAGAIGYVTAVLLARWMGSSEYGYYSFAVAAMTLLAYPATLGLPGAAVRFAAQYATARDWPHVAGLLVMSSWLTFGCSVVIALVGIPPVLYLQSYFNPGYVAPMIVPLAGFPVVALSMVRSEAIRGLGWLGLAWGPLQLGQPLLFLVVAVAIMFFAMELSASMVVGASIVAYG